MDRRAFLESLVGLTSGILVTLRGGAAADSDRLGGLLPQRILGKTGEVVTMLGLGGAHVNYQETDADAQAMIEAALEGGIRFFDTAALYGDGRSEQRLGKYLTPKYRDVVFLMTKAEKNTKSKVLQQLDNSLRNLKTDYVDLWQIHQVMSAADVNDRVNNGVLEAALEARESGKAHHIGFTGHRDPAAHQRMLELTDIFETCQMPINAADPNYGSFIRNVLPSVLDRNMGVLAMKTLGHGAFFGYSSWFGPANRPKAIPDRISIREAIHFVWSLPVSVLITGPDDIPQLQEKIDFARTYTGMAQDERGDIVNRVADLAQDRMEFFKATNLDTGVEDWRLY